MTKQQLKALINRTHSDNMNYLNIEKPSQIETVGQENNQFN